MPHALPVRSVLAALLACVLLLPAGWSVTSAPATWMPVLAGDDTKTGGGTG